MSPISIDHLIGLKAIEDKTTPEAVRNDLIKQLGTTPRTFKRLTSPEGSKCRKTTIRVIQMADYFQCKIDDLINPVYWENLLEDFEIRDLMRP